VGVLEDVGAKERRSSGGKSFSRYITDENKRKITHHTSSFFWGVKDHLRWFYAISNLDSSMQYTKTKRKIQAKSFFAEPVRGL
jgi:hypothetical protein